MKLDFWRIAMRPGKPLMVGSFGKTPVLGLRENRIEPRLRLLFLEPLIRKLASLRPWPGRARRSQGAACRQ